MTARIARGSSSRPRSKGKQTRGRKTQPPGLLDQLPIAAETIRRLSLWILAGMILALGLAVASAMQVPQMIGQSLGEAIGRAGFEAKKVEINGNERLETLPIYNIAYDQESMAMPLIDLDATRERMLKLGWVRDARISRRLPDTLVVDIVERQPAAVWQNDQRLSLIDRDGVVLEQVKLDEMPDLPLVIGPAANVHAAELSALLDATPQLRPILEGATWIGGRRWDLRFQSGETLSLPEGEASAKKALLTFARMDKATQLLGRGLVRFDMRIPGKFIVRISDEPGSIVPALAAPTTDADGQPIDATRTI